MRGSCEMAAGIWYENRMNGARVLVVDDEPDVRGLVRELLERAGATVREASDGREALRILFDVRPDCIVLDVSMPDLDGWATLERIRDMTDVPVLMLTARSAELEKVRGLQAGADDYVTKPFGRQELLARVDALLRRARRSGATGDDARETYEDVLVRIDVANAEVRVRDTPVALTPLEFRMLTAFVRHPDQVLHRDQLLELVWGDSAVVSGEQVKLYVGYLRRKLATVLGEDWSPVETVRGFGYRWSPQEAGSAAAP
jgi:DNA-binding response OmpR family regulator